MLIYALILQRFSLSRIILSSNTHLFLRTNWCDFLIADPIVTWKSIYYICRSPIKKAGLPIGRCTNKLLLRSRDRSRARSPIRGGRLVISLQPASSSANAVILPSSSGRDANLLCATSKVWRGSLHISRGSDVNWFRL